MNFEINAGSLNSELSRLVPITEKKGTNPVLSYAEFIGKNNSLKITTTDTVETLECFISGVNLSSGGRMCLPAGKLHNLIKSFGAEDLIKFNIEPNGSVKLSRGKSQFKLQTISPGAFPQMNDTFEQIAQIPAEDLRRMIKLSSGFIGEDDSRFAYSGAEIESTPGLLSIKATDGARIAYADSQQESNEFFKLLVPQKGLQQLASIIKEIGESLVSVSLSKQGEINKKVCFGIGNKRLIVNLTAGVFPDCSPVFNIDNPHKISINKNEFLSALLRMEEVSDKREPVVKMDVGNYAVRLSSVVKDLGEGFEEIPITHCKAMPSKMVSLGINLRYFIEFLSATSEITPKQDARITVGYTNETSFLELGIEDVSQVFRYIFAPFRLT